MFSNPHFSKCYQTPKTPGQQEEELDFHQELKDIVSTLPLDKAWSSLRQYQGFWIPEAFLLGVLSLRHHFTPLPTDLFLITHPKSGTTWLKALAFAILNRTPGQAFSDHPLLTRHPQDCSPFLEGLFVVSQVPDLTVLPSPRVFGTHIPYSLLPESVKTANCRIIYLCRDPKDTLVSLWHFVQSMKTEREEPLPLEKAFELLCSGISAYGPVWDHQLQYWKESQRRPETVLFLKYEDLQEEPEREVRRLAEFMGRPFSMREEREGVVREIVELCSFDNLSNLEVNKEGVRGKAINWEIKSSAFFRKGSVGDWMEHLSPEMAQRLDLITQEKFEGSGLSFKHHKVLQSSANSA